MLMTNMEISCMDGRILTQEVFDDIRNNEGLTFTFLGGDKTKLPPCTIDKYTVECEDFSIIVYVVSDKHTIQQHIDAIVHMQYEIKEYQARVNKYNIEECCAVHNDNEPLTLMKSIDKGEVLKEFRKYIPFIEESSVRYFRHGQETTVKCLEYTMEKYIIDPIDNWTSDFTDETIMYIKGMKVNLVCYNSDEDVIDTQETGYNFESVEVAMRYILNNKRFIFRSNTSIKSICVEVSGYIVKEYDVK